MDSLTIDARLISSYLQASEIKVTEIVTVSDRKRVWTRVRGSCLSFRDRRRRTRIDRGVSLHDNANYVIVLRKASPDTREKEREERGRDYTKFIRTIKLIVC